MIIFFIFTPKKSILQIKKKGGRYARNQDLQTNAMTNQKFCKYNLHKAKRRLHQFKTDADEVRKT